MTFSVEAYRLLAQTGSGLTCTPNAVAANGRQAPGPGFPVHVMTEQEWLASQDVRPMLDWLADRPPRRLAIWMNRPCDPPERRRLYLFASACYERVLSLGIDPAHRYLLTDRLPDDPVDCGNPIAPWNEGVSAAAAVTAEEWAWRWADAAARCVAWQRAYSARHLDWAEFKGGRDRERVVQTHLLRCVYGNPFRPAPEIDLDWLESAGRAAEELARTIAATNALDRLPELADALEAAGCADVELLGHCRQGGPHARGCWAIELLAGVTEWNGPPSNPRSVESVIRLPE
jgi:hypothetical protein